MFFIKRALPIAAILVLLCRSLYSVLVNSPVFEAVAFLIFSVWVVWICMAYSHDKDIPAYAGDFKFGKGQNQTLRALFAVTMASLQLLVAIVL
jgi:hypothetical protein